MPTNKSNILIILPAYNEATKIGQVIFGLKKEGFANICVVNDGSTDSTARMARQSGVSILSHSIKRGAGAAVQTGISFAKKQGFQFVILMDSDGQHLPEDIAPLIRKMEETKADIIIGNRFSNSNNQVPKHRLFYNQIANVFTNIFCKKNYSDTQSGFRLLNRRAIEKLRLKNRKFGFCSEMLILAERQNLKVAETPIQVLYTDYSMSKGQNFGEGIRTAQSILWRLIFE